MGLFEIGLIDRLHRLALGNLGQTGLSSRYLVIGRPASTSRAAEDLALLSIECSLQSIRRADQRFPSFQSER
jgi:hypothetical protein